MELKGALSNPRLQVELSQLGQICGRLLVAAPTRPLGAQPIPRERRPVLETVTRVLEMTDRPMRAHAIHVAAQELAGQAFLRTSVKAALAAGASGRTPRFHRVRHGLYQRAS